MLGFGSLDFDASDPAYAEYKKLFAEFGYEGVVPPIGWRRKTHSEYCAEFKEFYLRNKGDENLVIGNSFGAAVAYMTAPELKPDWLLVGSLSPFFAEDVGTFPGKRALWRFGKRRMADFNSYSAHDIASKLNGNRTVYLYGEKEKTDIPHLVARVVDSHKLTPGSQLVEIPDAGHKMRTPEYVDGIRNWAEDNL